MTPTIEGNKLIAEFMGYHYKDGFIYADNPESAKLKKDCKYHTSWDWLMPVVEKIRTLNPDKGKLWFEWEILFCHCRIWSNTKLEWKNNSGTTINAVFESVTQFIQWYNQQNQKQ